MRFPALCAGLLTFTALLAVPPAAQLPGGKAKAIGPKPDDPRTKSTKAIGPKPDDPRTKDPKAIGPKPDDPRTKNTKAIGPKPDDPRSQKGVVPAKR